MALTAQQEADLLSMLDAYKTGEQIDDLPAASTDATDKKIEVFDTKSGASQCMDLYSGRRYGKRPVVRQGMAHRPRHPCGSHLLWQP